MSKWIFRNEDGEREIVDLTDEEAALVRAARAAAQAEEEDDEDDEDIDGGGDDDDDPDDDDPGPTRVQDTPEEFERVDAVYRKQRAAIRASHDAEDLVYRRVSLEKVLRDPRQSQIAQSRARDLLDEIEQRELKILAERRGDRGR